MIGSIQFTTLPLTYDPCGISEEHNMKRSLGARTKEIKNLLSKHKRQVQILHNLLDESSRGIDLDTERIWKEGEIMSQLLQLTNLS